MNSQIEKNIPLPSVAVGRPRKYPFAHMEVGDSALFVDDAENAYLAAQACGRYHSKKFSRRKTDEGLRIWRIA